MARRMGVPARITDCLMCRRTPINRSLRGPPRRAAGRPPDRTPGARVRRARRARSAVTLTLRRSNGSAVVFGPPKSRADRRIIGIPKSIIPALELHLSKFVRPEPGALSMRRVPWPRSANGALMARGRWRVSHMARPPVRSTPNP